VRCTSMKFVITFSKILINLHCSITLDILYETNYQIRRKKDIPELVELCGLHAAYEQNDYNSEGKAEKLGFHIFSENPSLFCLVVELDNKLIGYATYMKQFSTWDANFYIYMDCLFLIEASRGFGIGEQLINRIKKEGSKLSCNLIQWQTPNFNVRAIKFYDRIGGIAKTKERYFLNI